METLTATAQDDSSGANPSSVKSEDSSPPHDSNRGSPPPNCAICLGTCRNKSFTDSCLHQFCFKCLLTWSRVKTVCPLCKQNFRSIIHNVRSNHQYEEYMVEQRQQSDDSSIEPMDFEPFSSNGRRFRYRTTLTLPRQDSLAIQQLLLRHYPMMMEMLPGRAPVPPPRRSSSTTFRRTVYRHDLWARPLPDFTGRFRDCTPQFYRYNASQMHRLVPWLNRELTYMLNENVGQITYVVSRILELLPRFHMHSTEFREAIQYYLREYTDHFIHELYCFASTPYDMTGYDRNVQYTTSSMSSMANVISSGDSDDSVDSDIVMVSSSGPSEPPPGPSRLPAPVYPQNYIPPPSTNNVIPIETISNSDTDDDSSEVIVVGYIKPPAARTPEVVDLVGSDSDVIVQEASSTPPRLQTQNSDSQDTTQGHLVELVLRKRDAEANLGSDSEDSAYTPPPPNRRRKRQRSKSSTSSSYTSDPSHATTSLTSTSVTESERSESSSSNDDESVRRRKEKKKMKYKRKHKDSHSDRHKPKRRKPRPCSKPTLNLDSKSNCNRKSISGKGVKSSKRKEPANAVQEEITERAPDQPSTSGINRNSDNRENVRYIHNTLRRLRSVVNIVHNRTIDGNSSGTSSVESNFVNACPRNSALHSETPTTSESRSSQDYSDSDDDLPLNLSMQKWSNPL
ncbi:hypothetical protein ACJJTC_012680 [Scirpophaga incertulas]